MFGLSREEFLSRSPHHPAWQAIYEDGSPMPAAEHPSVAALRSGKPITNVRAGVFNPRTNDYTWVNINAIPQFLPGESRPFQVFVTLHDFTGRKHIEEQLEASLKEKEVLLKELHHRTKNNMYVISAMLALQAGNTKDQQAQKVFQAMALTHQKLNQTKNLSSIDLADYIQDLARWLVQSYRVGANQISLNFELEPISILIDTAVPCGLILNELIANALEHAFPDQRPGQITIRLYRNQATEITLEVQDNGIGLPPDFNFSSPASFGLQVVKNIAGHQLQGRLTLEHGPGAKWRVSFKDNLYQTTV
jgi:two-component sensor histidine kinase